MKKQSLIRPILLGLIFGFLIGYIVAVERSDLSQNEVTDDHGHATDMLHSHGEHMHEQYEVQSEQIPKVDLIILEDPKSGWNLQINTQSFQFAPESASLEHIEGQGHSHLYINGEKITRIYSNWFHIPELEEGTHEITVDLTTNDHRTYAYNGEDIKDTETIIVS